MCLAKAESNLKAERPALPQGSSLIKFNPDVLPVAGNQEEQSVPSSAVSAELVIRVGCVSMDISSGMPVDRIAELVSALNSHA